MQVEAPGRGNARVSTTVRDLALQVDALTAAGCGRVHQVLALLPLASGCLTITRPLRFTLSFGLPNRPRQPSGSPTLTTRSASVATMQRRAARLGQPRPRRQAEMCGRRPRPDAI